MATSKEEKAYKTAESKDSCKGYMGTSALRVVEADWSECERKLLPKMSTSLGTLNQTHPLHCCRP